MKKRKGIILAGGLGTRLHPITLGVSKQLIPIYDKPMIYYPLSVLMLAKINEVLVITTSEHKDIFEKVLGDGSRWGMRIVYECQDRPDGIAQAYLIAENFLENSPSALVLGDNIFIGAGLSDLLIKSSMKNENTIFGYQVKNPNDFGIVELKENKIKSITEKPKNPKSNIAITGLYFLNEDAPDIAKKVKPSNRGELEITSILKFYSKKNELNLNIMGRGYSWLDTGTYNSLIDASNFVKTLQDRQGLQIGCPEEIAYLNKWIGKEQLKNLAKIYKKTEYGKYLENL